MKYLFVGGGTAGHINPALAVAEALQKKEADAELLFVSRCGGRENERIRALGYPVREIPAAGIERRLTLKNLRVGMTLLRGLSAANTLLREEKPNAVLGTGGYVSFPVLYLASQKGIPTLLHESNATPGLAARHLGARCDRILLGLPESESAFPPRCRTEVVGNPVRHAFTSLTKEEAKRRAGIPRGALLLLSFGGSLGSEHFNREILTLMREHSARRRGICHVHATGERYYSDIARENADFTKKASAVRILPYIEDMPLLMRAADIVISRAGAVTLAEIASAECAAILIPSPNVTENHQYKNAKHLQDAGAALLIEEKDLGGRVLLDAVCKLEEDAEARRALMHAVKSFCIPNAADRIADLLFSAAHGG